MLLPRWMLFASEMLAQPYTNLRNELYVGWGGVGVKKNITVGYIGERWCLGQNF